MNALLLGGLIGAVSIIPGMIFYMATKKRVMLCLMLGFIYVMALFIFTGYVHGCPDPSCWQFINGDWVFSCGN